MPHESRAAIWASIGANIVISASKFTAASITGSSVMIAEGVHSLVDSMDGALLFLGHHRARRPADARHPLGHGKELYFWALIVAVLFFGLGGGMSIYEGILHILNPEPLTNPKWNYIVLAIALVFDGISFSIAVRQFNAARRGRTVWQMLRTSKDPTLITLVLEDTADLTGIALAACGVYFSHQYGKPWIDGVASIGVGLVMATVAVFLMIESHGLLIGEAASPEIVKRVLHSARDVDGIVGVDRPVSIQMGADTILMGLDVVFRRDISGQEIARAVERLEDCVRQESPQVHYLYIEAKSLKSASGPPPQG